MKKLNLKLQRKEFIFELTRQALEFLLKLRLLKTQINVKFTNFSNINQYAQ